MIDFFRSIKFFIHNLIYWLPILWSDRDWDYNYLLSILIHKLDAMSKNMREYGHLENSEEVADQIALASADLRIVESGLFTDAVLRGHKIKWGEATHELVPRGNTDAMEMVTHYANAPTPELHEQACQELSNLIRSADEREHRLLVDTFTRMGEHLEGWWD